MDANINLWQSLALAVVQGITEFLPVSSSGHLVLLRRIFGWSDQGGLVFDTILHGGSLAAILIYFWREWISIIRAYFLKSEFQNPKSQIQNSSLAYYRRLPWLVALATIPAVVAGPVLKPFLESDVIIRNASVTGLSMIMTALLFLLAERRNAAPEKPIGFLDAFLVGLMQIVAFLPGASRSGWTTAGGIFCGQKRANAVRFAFFMAVPAIAGAMVFESREIIQSSRTGFDPFVILSGFSMSFAASIAAIHFCLKYFRNHSLRPFAAYLILTGLISFFFEIIK